MEQQGLHYNQQLADLIKQKASELGFGACGFAKASEVDDNHRTALVEWLENDHHGTMSYMENYSDKRLDPTQLVPGALTVIALAMNYHQTEFQPENAGYKISQYAAGIDYHHIIKKKLYQLLEFIAQQTSVGSARVFTDTAPVLERYWAQQAGLGAPGKNSCLILPRRGSFYFLAEIILDVELPYDIPFTRDMCGSCTRCMDACPTGAIVAPGKIDARKCTSYLTIESKEKIPAYLAEKMQGYMFGCDICQQVCPYNLRFANPCSEPGFTPLPAISEWDKSTWDGLDKATFRKNFIKARSPIARVSFEKLRDNIAVTR